MVAVCCGQAWPRALAALLRKPSEQADVAASVRVSLAPFPRCGQDPEAPRLPGGLWMNPPMGSAPVPLPALQHAAGRGRILC